MARFQASSPRVPLPAWARWNGKPGTPYTLGVEDEVMLLDPDGWSLAQAGDRVLASLPSELEAHVRPETHAAVVELVTGVHTSVRAATAEVRALRARLCDRLRECGLTAGAAGTHPAAVWAETDVSSAPRYRLLEQTMRSLVRREPTTALHVHVGVPDPRNAVRLLNALRVVAPSLLALSANSPFSQGRDGGFASLRRALFQAFPRTGMPRSFASYSDYVGAVDDLVGAGAVPDPSFLWWDVRLQPRLGTVELRMMDAQSSVEDIEALLALVQSFARLVVESDTEPPPHGPEVVDENAFLAARDGMEARLIDPDSRTLVPVRDVVEALVQECGPHAAALGCARELEGVRRLAERNGAQRQREWHASEGGLDGLLAELSRCFATAGERMVTQASD